MKGDLNLNLAHICTGKYRNHAGTMREMGFLWEGKWGKARLKCGPFGGLDWDPGGQNGDLASGEAGFSRVR